MKKILKKFNKFIIIKKHKFFFIFLFLIIFFIPFKLVFADTTTAISNGIGGAVAILLSWIALLITSLLGLLTTLLVKVLINVAQFNHIIDVQTVKIGWTTVRDICNMFFILILLVIAFGTILRVESYNAKKLLPKLLLMAVLINFSKTIFGLVIDFAQVIMLTFTNAFSNGGGWFIDMFNVKSVLSSSVGNTLNNSTGFENWALAVSVIAGVFASIITLIVVAVMLAVLVMRVIMLWVYTILSPLFFFGLALPALQKYTNKIWEDFIKAVITGPMLAFFIWLALTTVGGNSGSSANLSASNSNITSGVGEYSQLNSGQQLCLGDGGMSDFFCDQNLQNYIIFIGLLLGGLMVTQQIGGAAGSIAGKGMSWAKKAPLMAGGAAIGTMGWGARKLKTKTGLELRPTKIIQGFRETLAGNKEQDERMGESKAGAAMKAGKLWGALGASRDFSEAGARGFMWHNAWYGKNSVINQTRMRGKTQKEIEKLEKELGGDKRGNMPTEARKAKIQEEIKNKKEEIKQYRTPETFYADEKRNAMVRDSMKGFYDNDNADYLHNVMMNAFKDGMADVALASYLQMFKAGHSNEAMEKTVALEDYKNEKGEAVIKKGDYLPASQDGARAFKDQYLKSMLGLSEQEACALNMQAATMAKSARHFNLAEMIGADNGMLYMRTKKEQNEASAGEYRKNDPETMARQSNRLGSWEEKVKIIDGKPVRVAIASDLTKENFINQLPTYDKETSSNGRFNSNHAENAFLNYFYHKMSPESFDEHEQETLLSIAESIPGTIKGSGGKETTAQKITWQIYEKGKDIYKSRLDSEKNVDIANKMSDEELEAKYGKKEEILKKIEEEIKKNIPNKEETKNK